jgi:hypothetical protein
MKQTYPIKYAIRKTDAEHESTECCILYNDAYLFLISDFEAYHLLEVDENLYTDVTVWSF